MHPILIYNGVAHPPSLYPFLEVAERQANQTQHVIIVIGMTTGSSAMGMKNAMNNPAIRYIVPRTL